MKSRYSSIVAGLLCSSMLMASPAFADDASTVKLIEQMQAQIKQLQTQLDEVK